MPPFWITLMQLLQFLPGIVRAVESIHGSAPSQGVAKLQTAVNLVAAIAPSVAQQIAAAPANQTKLETVLSGIVSGINAAKSWDAQQSSYDPLASQAGGQG